MRLFQKVKSVSLESTVSEHSRAIYQNASLNKLITFVRKSKDKEPQVYEINYHNFIRDLKILVFFCILVNDLSNNRL